MKSLSVTELHKHLQNSAEKTLLIDVRTVGEYQSEHIPQASNIPLDQIEQSIDELKQYDHVYVQCQSGNRSSQACKKLADLDLSNMMNVEGGIKDWKKEGFPTIKGKTTISLFRQIQIVAGILILAGVGLSVAYHPGFVWLSAFVGAGLLFAGVSGTCAMGALLSKMPWNK